MRFLAAAFVLLYHCAKYVPGLSDAQAIAGLGYTAVCFFFVMSGFVLAWSDRGVSYFRFVGRRLARIWPLHAVTAVAAILLFGAGQRSEVFANLTLLQGWVPSSEYYYSLNGVSWSLSCELFFYAAFPFLVRSRWVLDPARRRVALITGFILWLATAGFVLSFFPNNTWEYLLYVSPPSRVFEFAIGVVAANAMRAGWRPPCTLRSSVLVVGCVLLVASAANYAITDGVPSRTPAVLANILMVAPFTLLITSAAAADISGQKTTFSGRTLVRLGEWSFALYLVHELVLRAVLKYEVVDNWVDALVISALIFSASQLVAALLHEYVERPGERWVRRKVDMATAQSNAESRIGTV